MKKVLALLLLCSLLLPLLAQAQTETVAFTDSVGRVVQLPKNIQRIAPSGPVAQMALLPLAQDLLVGLSLAIDKEAAQYLGTAAQLPVIGQLYGGKGQLNLEELARLDPQVIIDVGEPKKTIKEDLDTLQAQLGIPCVHITMGLADAGSAYRLLGQLLNRAEKAEALAAYCEQAYAKTLDVMEKVGPNKAKLLYCLGEKGLNVCAKGSFHSQVLDLVADNAAQVDQPSSKGLGNEVDAEQLYVWNPQYILFAPDSAFAHVAGDPTWQKLDAVKNGNYVKVPFGPYNWIGYQPGVQRYLGLLWLLKLLYPQAADFDLQAEVSRYYQLFYGHALTQQQYDALVKDAFVHGQ